MSAILSRPQCVNVGFREMAPETLNVIYEPRHLLRRLEVLYYL